MVFSLWKYNTPQCFGARNIQVKVQWQAGRVVLCHRGVIMTCWPKKFGNLHGFPLSNGFLAH